MKQTSRRRRGSLHHESPDAATEQDNRSTPPPSREEAFAAFCTVLAYASGLRAEPVVYDQWHLPADAKSEDAYKRRHRELRKVGVVGAWVRGKKLCSTAAAWATEIPRTTRLTIAESSHDVDAELDAALGIKTRVSR